MPNYVSEVEYKLLTALAECGESIELEELAELIGVNQSQLYAAAMKLAGPIIRVIKDGEIGYQINKLSYLWPEIEKCLTIPTSKKK